MRVLTVCVAVADYPTSCLRPGESPLRHSVIGLQTLQEQFRRIWPKQATHLAFFNNKAQFKEIRADLERRLSQDRSRPELLVFVFAGHGRVQDTDSAVLCFFPDASRKYEIEA